MSKLRLVKLMFLVSKRIPLYYFVPYKYGPFSFQLYHDLSRLERDGFVSIDHDSVHLVKTELPSADLKIKNIVRMNSERFSALDDKALLDYIYEEHPEFTIFSQYKKRLEYDRNSSGIVTIGYEGKTIDKFLYELIKNKIGIVVDVRRNAYSMKFGFQRNKLKSYLEKIGIDPGRVKIVWCAASEGEIYAKDLKDFIRELKAMGPIGTELKSKASIDSKVGSGAKTKPEAETKAESKTGTNNEKGA